MKDENLDRNKLMDQLEKDHNHLDRALFNYRLSCYEMHAKEIQIYLQTLHTYAQDYRRCLNHLASISGHIQQVSKGLTDMLGEDIDASAQRILLERLLEDQTRITRDIKNVLNQYVLINTDQIRILEEESR